MRPLVWILAVALAGSVYADEAGAARAMNRAKRTEPELIAFLKGMPKGGDLHVHIGGALYSDYLVDNAVKRGLYFDPATGKFTTDSSKVPAAKLLTDNGLLYQFLNAVSMRGWMGGGQSGHDHFFDAFGYLGSARQGVTAEDMLTEVVSRARSENEQYMELMIDPAPPSAARPFYADLPSSKDFGAALAALMPKLAALSAASKPYLDGWDHIIARRVGVPAPIAGAGGPINIRYIYSANRLSDNDEFFADIAAGLYLAAHDPRVVAINIVAPEDHPNARLNFDWQMRVIDFLWNRLGKPNVTLHAGELTLAISPVEVMRDRIRKSIEIGHAKRIGHGVSIAWENDLPGLFREMRQKGVAVEICLTSNMSILGVSGDRHPLHLYRSAKVPVFLNTDDEGVSRSNLTMECVRAVHDQGMTYLDLKEMARNSIEYSFLRGKSLYVGRDFARLNPAFAGVRKPDWAPSARGLAEMNKSEKLRIQVRLERAFVKFESNYN